MSERALGGHGMTELLPGASIGVVGGGQLGRYFVLEARRLGYDTWVLDPDVSAPAMQVCAHPVVAAYDDIDALEQLARACDAVTTEFENVPASSLQRLQQQTRVAPSPEAVALSQDRLAEKQRALQAGLTPVPHAPIFDEANIEEALEIVGLPAILKTTRLGYDGKGQRVCESVEQLEAAFIEMGRVTCVLEHRVNLAAEVSVVLARGWDGATAVFPVSENVHEAGILVSSMVPSSVDESLQSMAREQAVSLAEDLDYCGTLAVEFFITQAGELLFNEMAPRPHNSGHYTLDATVSSQFEQQLRALCALPLASTELLKPVCMVNLLGDLWAEGEPAWHSVFEREGAALHLYGKSAARPGRKMGHVNLLGEDAQAMRAEALAVRACLSGIQDESELLTKP